MPSRDQVRQLREQGYDYPEIARRLGVPAGQAYLIGTGIPVDDSDFVTAARWQPAGVLPSAQHLLGVPAVNPTSRDLVRDWIKSRVAADAQMRAAHTARARPASSTNERPGATSGTAEEAAGGHAGLD